MDYTKKVMFNLYVFLLWHLNYFRRLFYAMEEPAHILFCLCDHYEPGAGGVPSNIEVKRVKYLMDAYPGLAERHRDYYNNIPKRTWFFPPHYHRYNNLKNLVKLCEKGYGEIELHLHHGKHNCDTSQNLRKTLLQCIEEYSQYGIFGSENGETKYGFIHGDWALDNSRNGQFCGVDDEIGILIETGCYADFTFPSLNESNPIKINSIYYAKNNPGNSKSYNYGCSVGVRKPGREDLMIIQGPIHPFFLSNQLRSLRCLGDAINGHPPTTEKRIDSWVKTNINVRGRKNWIIIKTHTHGATDSESVLGNEIDHIFSYLENNYNDGRKYILHYVTARELYNIISAVGAGESGDNPEQYRNYRVTEPTYDATPDISSASEILKNLIAKTYA